MKHPPLLSNRRDCCSCPLPRNTPIPQLASYLMDKHCLVTQSHNCCCFLKHRNHNWPPQLKPTLSHPACTPILRASPNSSWFLWSACSLATARQINLISFHHNRCVPDGLLWVGFNREHLNSKFHSDLLGTFSKYLNLHALYSSTSNSLIAMRFQCICYFNLASNM